MHVERKITDLWLVETEKLFVPLLLLDCSHRTEVNRLDSWFSDTRSIDPTSIAKCLQRLLLLKWLLLDCWRNSILTKHNVKAWIKLEHLKYRYEFQSLSTALMRPDLSCGLPTVKHGRGSIMLLAVWPCSCLWNPTRKRIILIFWGTRSLVLLPS